MAKILSFNGYTRPAEQEEAEIIKEIDNSRYYALISPQGKYTKEWNQIMKHYETDKSGAFMLLLSIFAFGCIVGKREERAKRQQAQQNKKVNLASN